MPRASVEADVPECARRVVALDGLDRGGRRPAPARRATIRADHHEHVGEQIELNGARQQRLDSGSASSSRCSPSSSASPLT